MINARQILKEVELYYDLKPKTILNLPNKGQLKKSSKIEARDLFIALCLEHTRWSYDEIGEALNCTKATVYEAHRRFKHKKDLQNIYTKINTNIHTSYSNEL